MLILTDTQKCNLAIDPRNAKGQPAPVDGIPQWSSSNPGVCDIQPAADGLSAYVFAVGTGASQISVTADADLGAGVRNLTGTLDVEVRAGEAVTMGIAAGTPEEQ